MALCHRYNCCVFKSQHNQTTVIGFLRKASLAQLCLANATCHFRPRYSMFNMLTALWLFSVNFTVFYLMTQAASK